MKQYVEINVAFSSSDIRQGPDVSINILKTFTSMLT